MFVERWVKVNNKEYLTHSVIHYLLAIHKLYEAGKRTRYVDIATYMGVAKSSMSVAVKRLKENELVNEDKNRNLFLTEKGHRDVHNTLANRTLLYYFFKDILGVDVKSAERDACNIEHLLGEETQKKLFNFLKEHGSERNISNENKSMAGTKPMFSFMNYKTLNEFKESQIGDSHLAFL
jgi:DtxR family Mn-dependent transcriptional regulator